METHRHRDKGAPWALAEVQAKAKAKERVEDLKHFCCGRERHKKAFCKFKTATVCRNTNTHEIEKDADEPSPEVTVEAVWCMAVQDTVENDHCDHMEKHEGSSEHRDESKLEKSSRTSRRIKNHKKESSRKSRRVNIWKSGPEDRHGQARLRQKTEFKTYRNSCRTT